MGNYWANNPEVFDKVLKLWLKGLAIPAILKELGLSTVVGRSAVIAKLSRAGYTRQRYLPIKPPKIKPETIFKPKRQYVERITPLPKPKGEPTNCLVSLYDAKPWQCRWVMGEPKDMMFCGAPRLPTSKLEFCPYHHNRAHNNYYD